MLPNLKIGAATSSLAQGDGSVWRRERTAEGAQACHAAAGWQGDLLVLAGV